MRKWIRYNKLCRWLLLRLSDYVFEERILDFLFPDNMQIEFTADSIKIVKPKGE